MKRSDAFFAIIGAAIIALAFVFNAFYEEFAKAAVLQFFASLFGVQEAEIFARLTQMALPFMGACLVVAFIYLYLERQLRLPLETRSHFIAGPHYHCTSQRLIDKNNQPTTLYRNTYFLQIGNGLETGKALKDVQARIFTLGEPVLTRIKEKKWGTADIRHGEWVFVQIGSIVSAKICGTHEGDETVSDDYLAAYTHNTSIGVFSFEVQNYYRKRQFGLSYDSRMKTVWEILLVISADDVLSFQASIAIDMSDLQHPIKSIKPLRPQL
jgi:hypothetical protein